MLKQLKLKRNTKSDLGFETDLENKGTLIYNVEI